MKHHRWGATMVACALSFSVCGSLAGSPANATLAADEATAPRVAQAPTAAVSGPADRNDAAYVDGEVLVTWADDATSADKRAVREGADLDAGATVADADTEVAQITDDSSVAEIVQELKDDPKVESVQPNFRYQRAATDPYYSSQWALNNTGQNVGGAGVNNVDIDAPQAWAINQGSPSTIVAVIDTGVQVNHPDLAGNIWTNAAEAAGRPGVDDDGNGFVDDDNGWDFVNNDRSVYDGETCTGYGNNDAHGTHVAGIIAARRDSVGITGIAPKVKVLPLKILGCDEGSTAELVLAIKYARAMGAKIVNLSLGGPNYDPHLYSAINSARSAGILFVAAAGNGNTGGPYSSCYGGAGDPVSQCPMYPAAFNLDNIISVGAMTNRGQLASFSQYGSTGPGNTTATGVDIAAPGVNILSTVPANGKPHASGWAYESGTSMAAPYVTGVAALVKSKAPSWTGAQVRSRVLGAGRAFAGAGGGKTVTGRMVDAANALGRTGLSARAARPWIVAGQPAYLSTVLTSGTVVSGRTVRLYRYVPTTKTWVRECTTTTRADGSAVCKRYPTAHTTYRWQFAGDSYYRPVTSANVRLPVKARLTVTPQTVNARYGSRTTFAMAVTPNLAGRTVYLQRKVGSRWVNVATRKLASTSKAGASMPMSIRGTTYWRAHFPGDKEHGASLSTTISKVTVR